MAVNNRQNNLFAAEDWEVAYQAYSQVDFQAYDFDTMRSAMVDYIKTNFPENFNDYIESSEFIAIIELLAYLAQSIAFRMDVNTRENFLETAERKDSVYKLARQLGYNPKRNIGASGLMKVVSLATTEPLTDSLGNELVSRTVNWNDANNSDSYEQFITILNSAFGNVNRFSKPVKTGTIDDIVTDLYEINTPLSNPISHSFKSDINGVTRDFEFVNADFTDNKVIFEKHPDATNNFGIIHRNDGLGLSSKNNGFFLMFKQGILQTEDFNFTEPVENRQQIVAVEDINETDCYLQQIDALGNTLAKWTKVPNTVGQTLQYNTKAVGSSSLYAIQNRGDGGVNLQFADGNFAQVPIGTYRFYYRTSDPVRYQIQPDDVGNVVINIPYSNAQDVQHTLSITLKLQNSVNNSLPAESIEGIKERAPQGFYAQDRMVSAQDYQVLPLTKSTNISKIKVTNRTHAGHSRYIDITDPTSTFQTTSVLAEDGALFIEDTNLSENFIIDNNNTANEQITKLFPTYLKKLELNDFIYSTFRDSWLAREPNKFNLSLYGIVWNTLPKSAESVTGYLTETFTQSGTVTDVNIANSSLSLIQPGHLIKFENPADITQNKWVKVKSIRDNGKRTSTNTTVRGPITLSESVPQDWKGVAVITTLRKRFYDTEITAITNAINAKQTFAIGYNPSQNAFYVISNNDVSTTTDFSINNAEDKSGNGRDKSWLIKFNYVAIDTLSHRYDVTIRGIRYVFESYEDVRFYNVNTNRIVDSLTGTAKYDSLEITTLNNKSRSQETFEWSDTTSTPDYVGDQWYSTKIGQSFTNIPLKNRDTRFDQVQVKLISNFGLYEGGDTSANNFVKDATIELGTNFDTSDLTSNTNVTIANNTGLVHSLPSNIVINFTNTTFGANILDSNGNVSYKFENANFNNGNVMGSGHIEVTNANVSAQTGTLRISNFNNKRHYAIDSSGLASKDKLTITYINDRERLTNPIVFSAVGNFSYNDGYTDPRKVQVTPVNSTGDDSPDYPIQFSDFVATDDVIIFEDFNSFDGYTYTKPVKAGILDLRREDGVNFNADYTKIAGDSTGHATNGTGTIYNTADYEYFLVKKETIINTFDNTNIGGKLHNKKVYAVDTKKVYIMTYSSTNLNVVKHYESSNHRAKHGKSFTQNTQSPTQEGVIFKWTHVAENSMRIDPSISNVHEMFLLTDTYYDKVQSYLNVPGTAWPEEPTSSELENEFSILEQFKSASDQLLFKSGRFKLLFGDDAPKSLQARFKVVRLPGTSLSDNEIKTKIISAVNQYFNIDNWDFGDTFYFTELSSYIHQQVGNAIGSIVIVPKTSSGVFGDLFQVKCDTDELFLSTAKVTDIDIVDKLTSDNLKPALVGSQSFSSYDNSTEAIGPYAIDGYYPLYPTAEAANFAGDGTHHTHVFFGKTFFMPNGVTYYHGNYIVETNATVSTTANADVTNNTTGTSASSGSNSSGGGGGSSGSGY
jgi:hypothetical protein